MWFGLRLSNFKCIEKLKSQRSKQNKTKYVVFKQNAIKDFSYVLKLLHLCFNQLKRKQDCVKSFLLQYFSAANFVAYIKFICILLSVCVKYIYMSSNWNKKINLLLHKIKKSIRFLHKPSLRNKLRTISENYNHSC